MIKKGLCLPLVFVLKKPQAEAQGYLTVTQPVLILAVQ
jgi:hypothetical protein